MASQNGQQIIKIDTLLNISRSKCNQATKFGQLKKFGKYFSSKMIQE